LKQFFNTLFFTLLLATIAGAGIFIGYNAVMDRESTHHEEDVAVFASVRVTSSRYDTPTEPIAQTVYSDYTEMERFAPGAIIRFEHYTRGNNEVEVWEMEIPHALVDRTSRYLQTVFPQWTIDTYDSSGATLRREIPPPPKEVYLVSVTSDGFVAIFYDAGVDGSRLKDITNISINSLPETERERLQAGILVQGEDALMRLLEDLGS